MNSSQKYKRARLLALSAGFLSISALSHAAVIFQEGFNSGLGTFTSSGPVTTNASYGVRMFGSTGTNDGAITSPNIDTRSYTGISITYTRSETGMDAGETGMVEYSIDGGTTFTLVSNVLGSGSTTLALPANAAGQQALKLRFRVNASSNTEYLTVDNLVVEGTSTGTPPPPTNPPPTNPPPTNPPPAATCADNPYCIGPDPTPDNLEKVGPFTTSSYTVPSPSGYGSGTIYYPTNLPAGSKVGAIVVIPGLTAPQSSIQTWGPRMASHGFVTITIGTNSNNDGTNARQTQQKAALTQVIALSNATGNPISGMVDGNRLGMMGWSLGAGATLQNARDNAPGMKAGVPLAPPSTTGLGPTTIPIMVFACQNDSVLSINSNAKPAYAAMTSNKKAYMEIEGGSHSCANAPTAANNAASKYAVAWMKRWLDNDTRYSKILCGTAHDTDLAAETGISAYQQNCPY